MRRVGVAVLCALIMGSAVLFSTPAAADTAKPTAGQLAAALGVNGVVLGGSYVSGPPDASATLVGTKPLAGFPRQGGSFAVLSTGKAADAANPNDSTNHGTDFHQISPRSSAVHDATVLKVDLDVPSTANCLLGVDFRFLSEEYPEYVGSNYNDAFIAEVDKTTWTVSGKDISAPRNFAFDQKGNPITVNAAGAATMSAAQAKGTTFDGATDLLTAATPLTPGKHSLYFSLFDTGDGVYDSAVLLDNIRIGKVANVATDCKPGAVGVQADTYVALGDSYSSGFGVSPYESGTHSTDGGNDCQRSTRAYSSLVAASTKLGREFYACQGAVTPAFFGVQDGRKSWGETAQLDHLNASTGLVTYTIGGNDAGFADVLRDCIDGKELLPFVTCHDNANVYQRVDAALKDLDGTGESHGIHSYAQIFAKIRQKAENTQVVQLGYPHFYVAEGSDRTFLPGGRCEGVKKADQRWIVEKIDEVGAIIERQAGRAGYLYAAPNFAGHELCSGGEEWIYPILSDGRMHPTAAGHAAMAAAVTSRLDALKKTGFVIKPGQTVSRAYVVKDGSVLTTVTIRWPGSDVRTTLISPSGKRYTRTSAPSGHHVSPTSETFTVAKPEAGTWKVQMYGADIDPQGEQVTYSTYSEQPANARPSARATVIRDGDTLRLDAGSSSDSDGTVRSYDWYVETASQDKVVTGRQTSVALNAGTPASVTLVVTDNRGLTDFATVNTPGLIRISSAQTLPSGKVAVALLSSAQLSAAQLTALRWGPADRPVTGADRSSEDVNGDGRADLVLTSTASELGLKAGDTTLCVHGRMPDSNDFRSCVPLKVTSASTASPSPDPTASASAAPASPSAGPTAGPTAAGVVTLAPTSPAVSPQTGGLASTGGPSLGLLAAGVIGVLLGAGLLLRRRLTRR